MSRWSICINDVNSLNKILNYIKSNNESNGFDHLFSYFSFKDMIDNCPDTASLLLEILTYFLNNNKFLQNTNNAICYTIEFAVTNLSYFSRKEDGEMLFKLTNFLNNLFLRTKSVVPAINFEIDAGRFCEIIAPLVEKVYRGTLKYELALLITEIFSLTGVCLSDYEIIDFCISEFFRNLPADCLELCTLGTAALRVLPQLHLSDQNYLFYWLYDKCPQLLERVPDKIKIEMLNCVILAFETKNDENFKLTETYKNKLSFFYNLLRDDLFRKNIMKLFFYIINDLTQMRILPLMENEYIENFKKLDNSNKSEFYNDITLVINYLRCLQRAKGIDKEEIINSVINRCLRATSYPLMVLKALCLLYPMFVENHKFEARKISVENSILDAVAKSKRFSEIVTYHISQFQWFLESDRPILMTDALHLFLINCKNSKIILTGLKNTNNTKLLASCLLNDSDSDISNRACKLLTQLQCPSMSALVKQYIPKALRSERTLSNVFQANPALPDCEREAIFFCYMMSNVLPILNEKESFIRVCKYIYKILTKFKACPKTVEQFILNEGSVASICEIASKIDDEIAISAIILLIMFLKLQKRHSIKLNYSTKLDFRKVLKGAAARLLKALSLLQLTLALPSSTWVVTLEKEEIENVYYHLQHLECVDSIAEVFKTLAMLIKHYWYLAEFVSSAIFVELHCVRISKEKKKNEVRLFMLFLKEWVDKVRKNPTHLYIPLEEIYLFMKLQPATGETEEIMEMLKELPSS